MARIHLFPRLELPLKLDRWQKEGNYKGLKLAW